MTRAGNRNSTFVLTATVVTTVIVGVLYWARAFVIPLALATFLAFVLAPVVARLRRWGIPKAIAVLVVVAGASMLVLGIGLVLSWQITGLVGELPDHSDKIQRKLAAVSEWLSQAAGGRLGELLTDVEKALQPPGATPPGAEPTPVVIEAARPGWLSHVEALLGPAADAAGRTAFTFVLTVFLLLGREDMRNRLIRLIGPSRIALTTKAVDDAGARISRYLRAQLAVNAAFGIVLTAILLILGVRYAVLWGFVAALMRYVPYIGVWFGLAPPLLAAVAMTDGWMVPLSLLGAYAGLELLLNNVVEPRVFGQSLGLSEIAQVVSAAFWAFLWGPIGLVLSGPLTGCLLVIGKNVPQLRYLDVILSDDEALPLGASFFQRLVARDQDDAAMIAEAFAAERSPAETIDQLLLPALGAAQLAGARGEIDADDNRFIAQAVREIADDLQGDDSTADRFTEDEAVRVMIVPASGPGDVVAAEMLRDQLRPPIWEVELLPESTLASEAVAMIRRKGPAAVLVISLGPGGFAHTRYLCNRLRASLGDTKLFVGRWGQGEPLDDERQVLADMGVDEVTAGVVATTRLLDTWRAVLATPTTRPVRDANGTRTALQASSAN
ncbi:MAG: AI-2E family transporter [Gemmataceae bacterium]